jgi:hypothetical protein
MKLYPFQEVLLEKMAAGTELKVVTAGRNVGKSMFSAQALKRLMDDLNRQPITDMILTEGRVYGARYYCVEPVGGNWREMEDWCIATYGTTTGCIWSQEVDKTTPLRNERWYANNRKFWFRKESDRDWFLIKWRA